MFKIRRFAAYVLVVSPPLIRTVALVGCLLCSVSTRGMAQGVDLIVLNGKIYTVDEKPLFQKGSSPTAGRVFEAMAIRNDTITALGTNEEILKLAAPDTKRLDVQGRVVLPGLIDSHSHQTGFLLEDFPELTVVRIPPSADKGEVRKQIEEAIRKKVQETKPGSWIVVRPIGDAARELILFTEITRADLDRWAPNNPVELNETGSGANSQIVINTKAREIAERELPGLKKLSDHDLKGDGVMLDKNILQDILLQGREQDYSKSLKKLLIAGLSTGTTTIGTRVTKTPLGSLFILDQKGEMPLRYGWMFSDGSYYNPEGFYKRFPNMAGVGSKYLWSIGVGEEAVDSPSTGLCSNVPIINAQLRERFAKSGIDTCYLDHPFKRATVKDQIQYGRGVEYHASGDKTVDLLLEIVDEIRRETGMTVDQIRAKRLTMEHLHMVRPDQYAKLKEYGIIMANTPLYLDYNLSPVQPANVLQNFGEQYLKWMMPAKGFLDAGVYTVLSEYGNFLGIERMVTRKACFTPRLPGEGEIGVEKCKVLAPEQAIDRATALKMATSWPAYYMLRENQIGSLEVEKLADFIVLDRDYFAIPAEGIKEIKVLLTAIGGKVVYAAPEFGSVDRGLFKSAEYYGKAVLK